MSDFEYFDLSWLSSDWFRISFLRNLHWGNPFFLYLIPAVPFIFLLRRIFHQRLKQKAELSGKQIQAGRGIWNAILRRIPYMAISLVLILILTALGRPRQITQKTVENISGLSILVVLDISESMLLEDMKPNRLTVAKETASGFIAGRKHDEIGLIVFSSETYTVSPLTKDHKVLREYLGRLDPSLAPTGGTAIGDALATAYLRLQGSGASEKVIILITDGENTAGAIDPRNSAKLARSAGIKIHTISLGTEGRILYRAPEGEVQYVESYPDIKLLKEIASISGGSFYKAEEKTSLEHSFSDISTGTATKVFKTDISTVREFYQIYLAWAMILLIIWMLMKGTFMANAMED